MSVPEGRCGFVLGDRPAPSHLPDREYSGSPTVCCWRTAWDGSDSGRCFWHAKVWGKEGHDFPRVPNGHPERLDGAYLGGATFRVVDLSGVNLTRADLSGVDLWKVKLRSATLRGAGLFGATLRGTNFTEADLSGANLSGANLSGANLSNADLQDTLLFETDLSGANLSGANLSNADLSDATLAGLNLSRTELGGSRLARADLSGADLGYIDLSGVSLSGADLSGAKVQGTTLRGADLSGADLSGVDLSGTDVTDAALAGVDLTLVTRPESLFRHRFDPESEVSDDDFQAGDLAAADLTGVVLSGLDLGYVDISGWKMPGVDLSGANLSGANLSGANLSDADLTNGNLSEASLSDAKLRDADLTNATLSGANLSGANLSGATLTGTNLSGATLSRADFTAIAFDAEQPPALGSLEGTDGATFDSVAFAGADLRHHKFPGANFRYADLSGADLYLTGFEGADLTGAILDEADCRQAEFRDANLERASFIECDLRSAKLDGAKLYRAVMTDCEMDSLTTITEAFAYPPHEAEERALHPVRSAARSVADRTAEFLGLREEADDASRPEPADTRSPDSEDMDLSGWLERRAWTHQTIHRQLIRHGRIEQAIREKHYLEEQRARLRRARLERLRATRRLIDGPCVRLDSRRSEGDSSPSPDGKTAWYDPALWLGRSYGSDLSAVLRASLAVTNARTSYRLIRMGESPLYVARVILVVAALFAFVVYPSVGEFEPAARRLVSRTDPGFPISLGSRSVLLPWVVVDAWRLFVFSLLTFFEGTYLVLKGTFGTFLSFGDLEPSGVSAVTLSGIRPTGTAVRAAWVERFLGALLVVPFALLVVQRLRLYVGAATSEEGLGGGLVSWLLGR
jgi:uncharacterized protein YjbI with pentapeptide repeats